MLNFISKLRPTRSKSLLHPENAGLDELDFVKSQLAWLPTRAYVGKIALLATGSALALIAAAALLLVP